MTKIIYGGTEIPVTDNATIGWFQEQIGSILSRGGGWLTMGGTNDAGEPETTGLLITPGVPLMFQGEGTPESLGVSFHEVNTAPGHEQ